MDVLQIVALGLTATVLIVVVKSQRPDLAVLLSVAAGAIIFLLVLGKIGSIIEVVKELSERAGISMVYLGTILKIVGIAYIAEFGSQICRDAGEGAVASKIEFAAKVLIMVLAVPIVVAVLQSLLKLLW
ncbi:Stage III sporulation protein AC/AD protein family protein [Pelotomaculum schinkii]|uniref:Stage III sporulation protein AC/AD protein family protein n=1 Tax=Pelotomaculum schinkii TaxID=78350 RepID=A0A4Y7RD38_9FIRM|nr:MULTISPECIES: stage III sporulation protein AD [Pelotomaculum]TEB06653.1 Stage III sporulation protein AC/AD protein family protein [Pelotomaculum schinkii]TEB17552.1 Stage III sporulation protein AC/AD protein family protein [Pelotomaculum sp. FP]